MKQKRYASIFSWVLFVLGLLVAGLGIVIGLGTANSLNGFVPMIYGLGGQGLGDVLTGLLRPLLNSFSLLIGVGGIVFGLILFATGYTLRHYQTLSLRLAALEQEIHPPKMGL